MMRQCHWCGVHFDTLDPGDHLCGECRDELLTQQRAGLAESDVLCQQCGAEINPGRTLCRACEDGRWTGEDESDYAESDLAMFAMFGKEGR